MTSCRKKIGIELRTAANSTPPLIPRNVSAGGHLDSKGTHWELRGP